MAAREDMDALVDEANYETFGENGGWEAEEMLALQARRSDSAKPLAEHLAGTCGFLGMSPRAYAKRHKVVELNSTFHDRSDTAYESQASNYVRLGLRCIVKVSGFATHEMLLDSPMDWWPWLRSKYAPLVNAGALVALLWQFPPSFKCTEDALGRLDAMGSLLRGTGQTPAWAALHHAFEFRHSSWYQNPDVAGTLRRHSLVAVTIHVTNDTQWAGDLESGWHGVEDPGSSASAAFAYLRCFGSSGRSIGKYGETALHEMAERARRAHSAVVLFGQGDVPSQAFDNAAELHSLLESGRKFSRSEIWLTPASPRAPPPPLVHGRVVAIERRRDRRVILDVGGRRGYLGSRHSRKRGLNLRVGTVVDNLCVEAEDQRGRLVLGIYHAPASRKEGEDYIDGDNDNDDHILDI